MLFFSILSLLLFLIIIYQFMYIYHTKKQLKDISHILDDIKQGNLDRRLYANEKDITSELVYKINDIVMRDKSKFLELNKSEKAYKELVTSLSHDIRTPLTSLIGFLDALDKDNVAQEEREEFIKIAKNKALNLSGYIQKLFEWLKLESGEYLYSPEEKNICEQTRIILADWIIKFEKNKLNFQIDIPDDALFVRLDINAYERIINNLLTNIMEHSNANFIAINLIYDKSNVVINISDNGIGISEDDIPNIYDRLYKCDNSRSKNSNGLGLAIVKELVTLLDGKIDVNSKPKHGSIFTITFPCL